MGLYNTKEEIVRAAIKKISSVPVSASASFVSPEEEEYLSTLSEIIASDMEETIYPFSVTYMQLENPLVDEELNPENDKLIYSIPSHAVSLGVFTEESLPTVADVVSDSFVVREQSQPYSFFGGDKLIVNVDPEEEETLYFVHTSNDPEVSRMFTSYQRYLVFELAYENYFRVGTNSRFLESLRRQAMRKKSIAKRLCMSNLLGVNRHIVTLNQILFAGQPDGSIS